MRRMNPVFGDLNEDVVNKITLSEGDNSTHNRQDSVLRPSRNEGDLKHKSVNNRASCNLL